MNPLTQKVIDASKRLTAAARAFDQAQAEVREALEAWAKEFAVEPDAAPLGDPS